MTDTVGMEGYFTPEHAEEVFSELVVLRVELDSDPLTFGPKRLNAKTAEVRRMCDRCERLFLDISARLHRAKRAMRLAETDLDLAKKNLFANDPEVKAGRSVADREAVASGKLAQEVQHTRNLMITVGDLESVLVVVKAKRADLKDTEGRLRDQMKLCQEELVLGHRWGSRLPGSVDTPDIDQGRPADEAKDLQEMIGKVEGEIHLAQARGDFPTDPDAASGEDSEDEDGIEDLDPVSTVDSMGDIDDMLLPESVTPAEDIPVEPAPVLVEVIQTETVKASDDPFDGLQEAVSDLLPGTTAAKDADDFLASVPMEIPSEKPVLDSRLALDDDQLLAMLTGFESHK